MTQTTTPRCNSSGSGKRQPNRQPIEYHIGIEESFDWWAQFVGSQPRQLRARVKKAIRTQRHEAIIEDDADRAQGIRPNVYLLDVGPFGIYFTDEEHAIVIRGFCIEPKATLDPSEDRGLYFCDAEWSIPY